MPHLDRCRSGCLQLSAALQAQCSGLRAEGQGVRWRLLDLCLKQDAFCTRVLHRRDQRQLATALLIEINLGLHTSVTSAGRRGRRPRGATPRRRSKNAGTASSSSSSPRTRVAAETKDTSTRRPRTARSRSGPARTPWTNPGHDTEIPREANGLPSWRRRGAVVLRLSPSSGADETQSTRRRGGRGSPRTTVTRLGSGGAILRAAQPQSTAGPCPRRRAAPTARAARAKREA